MVYQFKCKECKHLTDNEDSKDTTCPECGGELMKTEKQDKLKLPITNMTGVEIMEIGKWKGLDWTKEDFDEAIKNHKTGLVEGYITLDHNPKATDEGKRAIAMSGFGYIKNLYMKGKKLLADFKQVPKAFAELVEAGALKKRSVEWWRRGYKHADGNRYNNVLQSITFFGANGVPAVNTLADIKKFYKLEPMELQSDQDGEKIIIDFKNEEDINVGEIKIDQAEYDRLKTNQRTDEDKQTLETMKAEKVETDKKATENETAKLKAEKENVDLKKQIEDKATTDMKAEAEEFIHKVIEEKKLLPKYKEMKVAEYIRLKKEDEETLKLFKEQIETSDKILNFGVITKDGEVSSLKFKSEDSDIKGDPTERAEKVVRAIMKRDDITWKEAYKKSGLGDDEEEE